MKNNKKKQQGITLIGLIVFLAVLLFLATLAIKLLPYYIENMNVTSSLESIASDINSNKIKPKDIKPRLLKRLQMNNISHITQDEIMISGGEAQSKLSIEYEVRLPFMANIDFVIKFSNAENIKL